MGRPRAETGMIKIGVIDIGTIGLAHCKSRDSSTRD